MRMDGLTRLSGALAATVLALATTGCGGDDSSGGGETWKGEAVQTGIEVEVGTWKGDSGSVKVECSGDAEAPTATLTVPDGFVATTTMPEGGGRAAITVTGPDDREVTWDEHGIPNSTPAEDGDENDDNALTWAPNVTFTTPQYALVEEAASDYVVDLNEVQFSCDKEK